MLIQKTTPPHKQYIFPSQCWFGVKEAKLEALNMETKGDRKRGNSFFEMSSLVASDWTLWSAFGSQSLSALAGNDQPDWWEHNY